MRCFQKCIPLEPFPCFISALNPGANRLLKRCNFAPQHAGWGVPALSSGVSGARRRNGGEQWKIRDQTLAGLFLSYSKCLQSRFAEVDCPTNPSSYLYYYSYKEWVNGFVRELTFAKRLHKHFMWDKFGVSVLLPAPRERMLVEVVTSDRELEASREGPKWLHYGT